MYSVGWGWGEYFQRGLCLSDINNSIKLTQKIRLGALTKRGVIWLLSPVGLTKSLLTARK